MAIQQQKDTADAQSDAIREAAKQNYDALSRQGIEQREDQTIEQQNIQRDTIKRVSSATAATAADGVGGASVAALLGDLAGAGAQASANSETNYLRQGLARQDKAKQVQNQTASQLSSVQYPTAADYGRTALSIGNAYTSTRAALRGNK